MAPSTRLWVINGPNLDRLGQREPQLYGRTTLAEIEGSLTAWGEAAGVAVTCHRASGEGALADLLGRAGEEADGVVINPGGYAHTSVVVRDAMSAAPVPVIEVHLTNVHAREPFRQRLLTAGAARGLVAGLGPRGYRLALEALNELIEGARRE